MKLKTMFYRNGDDPTGGEPVVTTDGTAVAPTTVNAVTRDDLMEFGNVIGDKFREAMTPEPEPEPEPEIPEAIQYDPKALQTFIQSEIQRGIGAVRGELAATTAPLYVQSAMKDVKSGLDEVGQAYIDKQLAHANDIQKQQALQSPEFRQMLINAAKFESIQKGAASIPGSHDPAGNSRAADGFEGLTGDEIKEVEAAMRTFGLDKKEAIKTLKDNR